MDKRKKTERQRGFQIPTRIIISGIFVIFQLIFFFLLFYDITERSATIYVIITFLAAIMVAYIVNHRGNPNYKIMWIIFIMVIPIFGVPLYLLWGGSKMLPSRRLKMENSEARYYKHLPKSEEVMEKLKYTDIFHSRQAEYLIHESGFPVYENTTSKFLSSGEAFFESYLHELEAAEKYIFIEFFILAEGEMWQKIYKILKEKAAAGIEVKIIFDDFGSIKRQGKNFITRLRKNGISVSVFNPIKPSIDNFMNNRNHRKITVIDGKTAFTGGMNIGDEYINLEERFGHWLDCGIVIKGEAVTSFLAMFCSMWEFITGKQMNIKKRIASFEPVNEGFYLPYCDDPLNKKNPAEGIYMQIINSAQKYVYIATPYLIIDNTMIGTLKMAAKSGIDVRIFTPHIPDKWYVHPVTQYNYLELIECGIKIYEYTPGFLHSKLFVSDDRVATVGSVNMDYRSFVFHFECGVWINDNSTVLDIRNHFDEIIEKSHLITLGEWEKRPVRMRIKQSILHLFAPFM